MTQPGSAWHGSAVCFGPERGVLILGASGRGKSALALDLIDRGATLVADDRVILWPCGGAVFARPPARIAGLIEQRGLGLLRLRWQRLARIRLIVDLDAPQAPRLPTQAPRAVFTIALPCLTRPQVGSFSAAIQRYVMDDSVAGCTVDA